MHTSNTELGVVFGIYGPAGLRFMRKGVTPIIEASLVPVAMGEKPRQKIRVRTYLGAGMSVLCVTPPPLEALLFEGVLADIGRPFILSLSAQHAETGTSPDAHARAVALIQKALPNLSALRALMLDIPSNTAPESIAKTVSAYVHLPIPVMVRVSVQTSPEDAVRIVRESGCAGLVLSGALPWDDVSLEARNIFFRRTLSPFPQALVYGKYIRPLALEWLVRIRREHVGVPVIAGGGILGPHDARAFIEAGASAVVLDRSIRLRPWNVIRILHSIRAGSSSLGKPHDGA